MAKFFICSCCRCRLPVNPRIKNQRYCGREGCQRERKRKWQASKMASDLDYRANQQDAYHSWRERNPDYWRHRRQGQILMSLSLPAQSVSPVGQKSKMDTIELFSHFVPGTYLITPIRKTTRKMDAIKVKIIPFSGG